MRFRFIFEPLLHLHTHREEREREKLHRANALVAESRQALQTLRDQHADSDAEFQRRLQTKVSSGELRAHSELASRFDALTDLLEQEIRVRENQATLQAELYRRQRAHRELWQSLRDRRFSAYCRDQKLRNDKQADEAFLLTRQNLPGADRQS